MRIISALLYIGFGTAICWISHHPTILRHYGAVSAMHDVMRLMSNSKYSAHESDPIIECWGDSLTAGAGTSVGHDYPSLLQYLYHRPTKNEGVGGETSSQIKARMLGRKRTLGPERAIFWVGRNNSSDFITVLRDIQEMSSSLNENSEYLVIGAIVGLDEGEGTEQYRNVKLLNSLLAKAYGNRFVLLDFVEVADKRNYARSDKLHLNDTGQAMVATAVERRFQERGL